MALPPKVYQFLVGMFAALGSFLYGYDLNVLIDSQVNSALNCKSRVLDGNIDKLITIRIKAVILSNNDLNNINNNNIDFSSLCQQEYLSACNAREFTGVWEYTCPKSGHVL